MISIPYSKYSGSGNDFVMIDNRRHVFPAPNRPLINMLCQRDTGIGADGVILLENSSSATFKMRIFNADGSEAEMCGNGIRCLMKFLQELGYTESMCHIETKAGILRLSCIQDQVCASMPLPTNINWNLTLTVEENPLTVHSVNTGVPHAILFLEDIDSPACMELAPKIRHHPFFGREGTNVNFVKITPAREIRLRTYERGVEGETLACGTGAVAAALAAAHLHRFTSPIRVFPKSNETIAVNIILSGSTYEEVSMIGPASRIHSREFVLN